MKNKTIYCMIMVVVTLCYSCKQNKVVPSKLLDEKIKIQDDKKYLIPSNLKIEKKEEVNIDNDESKEIIITAVDEKADYFYEFWFKNDKLLYEFKYYWGDVNKKWLVNIDNDETKEIVRMQGYADGNEVKCVIFDIINKQQVPLLYFNPLLADTRFPNQYMWAYSNDVKDLIINNKNELRVSLNNSKPIDNENPLSDNQIELPYIYFNGQTSQPDMKISNINIPEFMSVQTIINKVKKNKSTINSEKIVQQWKGNYDCNFLRMKDEYADPRAYGMIYININNNESKFKLDTYVEIIDKDLIVLSSSPTEIILSERDNINSKFTITKNNKKYELKSDLLNNTVGETAIYKLVKK